MIWLKFAAIQAVMLLATVLGWFLLLPFCWAKAWTQCTDYRGTRVIDEWKWAPLNWLYSNREDGVSGRWALIWTAAGQHIGYMPNAPLWWRAYCWSGWRNSCDNLKYLFADPAGPLKVFTYRGFKIKIGWQLENGFMVPVVAFN